MIESQAQQFIPLVVVTIIGLEFRLFGYELGMQLLRWIVWIGGVVLGAVVGWIAAPSVITQTGQLPTYEPGLAFLSYNWVLAALVIGGGFQLCQHDNVLPTGWLRSQDY